MQLKDFVKITPRFQRAIRIDTDLGTLGAISGFVCPKSSSDALLAMSRHIAGTNQGAFTWTGPYGSGKSSLVVAFCSLLNGKPKCTAAAREALGASVADELVETLPLNEKGWRILPVVGRRENPIDVIGEALENSRFGNFPRKTWTEETLRKNLLTVAEQDASKYGGLVVVIDEMGKFLEGAAQEGSDIYFFQQLAETASRSNKRLIVIGILHQAFEDYAHRLSREMRDEWSKIQGRFIDLPINVAGEEQIDLLSRAIKFPQKPKQVEEIASKTTAVIQANKRGVSPSLGVLLAECWPIHPVVACLLGAISRRRFGQNQRSLFGFLNSAEPHAFQDFLNRADFSEAYTIEHLWEYLRTNLEASILASSDGHRWAMAVDAVDRCEAQLARPIHLQLLKAVALIDLFKGNSGLMASLDLLETCYPQYTRDQIDLALNELRRWSIMIYKAHIKAYVVYAGSDFDIDAAVQKARNEISVIDFQGLKRLAGVQPILAKRHYHSTGTLRWFDVELVPLKDVVGAAESFKPTVGTIGQFLLAIPTENESKQVAFTLCREAAKRSSNWDIVVGLSNQAWAVNDNALEILATEKVYSESTDLGGDSVARREVRARLSDLQSQLESVLSRAFNQAQWFHNEDEPLTITQRGLSVLASNLADARYPMSPRIHNELLNRIKPSSNAVAAQNALLKRMVLNEGESRLGINGFPAEGGLFFSILEATKLYDNVSGVFLVPEEGGEDPYCLKPLWDIAADYIRSNSHRTIPISEIYHLWRQPPYGVRDGLMPVLVVSFVLSLRSRLAFYRDGIFQSWLKDIDIDVLIKNPSAIQLRHINLSPMSKRLLSGMAEIVRELDPENVLHNLEPIDVARGLVAIYHKVHPWAQRTMHLSKDSVRIRNLFKKANDPNKFLFDDIPGLLGDVIDLNAEENIHDIIHLVSRGLKELTEAYPRELNRLREIMLAELQVPNQTTQAISELRDRAANIKHVSGDFRLEAFIVRLAEFRGTDEDMEGIASLASNKPPKIWVDNDADRAKVELTQLAQNFIRMEAFARVKGRADKRLSLSVIVGIDGRPTPVHCDFDILDSSRNRVDSLIGQMEILISKESGDPEIILAALAELSARYIEERIPKSNFIQAAKR